MLRYYPRATRSRTELSKSQFQQTDSIRGYRSLVMMDLHQEVEMEEVLDKLGFAENIKEKFKQEKIQVSTVPLLLDEDLISLGVEKLGERAELRRHCQNIIKTSKVSSEVRSVMGSPSVNSYNIAQHSFSGIKVDSTLPRRSKRKFKNATDKYSVSVKKGKSPTFQKKVVVFKYMGPNPPQQFTRCEEIIIIRGLLPPISVDSSEEEIREEICASIHKDFPSCSNRDFEFVDVNGKRASVPNYKRGFEFDGRAVKQLAGSGSLYVRLVKPLKPVKEEVIVIADHNSDVLPESSDSDSSLPPVGESIYRDSPSLASLRPQSDNPSCHRFSISNESSLPQNQTSMSSRNDHGINQKSYLKGSSVRLSSHRNSLSFSHQGSSLSHQGGSSSLSQMSSSQSQGSSLLSQTSSSQSQGSSSSSLKESSLSYQKSSLQNSFSQEFRSSSDTNNFPEDLVSIFPDVSLEMVNYIYDATGKSVDSTIDFLVSGCTKESLISLKSRSMIVVPLDESPKLHLANDETEWVESALAFYKGAHFKETASMRVRIERQAGVDTGGLRRQFFATIFETLADSSYSLFEGYTDQLRPAYKATNLSSGMLTLLGVMIGHSLMLDSQGFPFLSEYCYYYMCGLADKATTCVSQNDLTSEVKAVIEKLAEVGTEDIAEDTEILDMMAKSGCDIPLTLSNRSAITETIILYDAIIKRAPYLDAICKGLDRFGLKKLIHTFPEIMKPFFVSSGAVSSEDVISKLRTLSSSDKEHKVWNYLLSFLRQCTCEELRCFVQFTTGTPVLFGKISVTFTSHKEEESISASTCSRTLTLSTLIEDEEIFICGMKAIIPDRTFTMP